MIDSLSMLTVYENPSDHPGRFVVRKWDLTSGQLRAAAAPLAVVLTLEEARDAVRASHPDAVRILRCVNDDPVIVETWI